MNRTDKLIQDIQQRLNLVRIFNSINAEKERQKFFDSDFSINPQFEYNYPDLNTISSDLSLINKNIPDSEYNSLYRDKLHELNLKYKIVKASKNNKTQEFTKFSIELYDLPQSQYIYSAKKLLNKYSQRKKDTGKKLDFHKIIDEIITHLENQNLDTDIKIVRDKNAKTSFRVNHIDNQIIIHENSSKTKTQLESTLAHEVDVHLIRAQKGKIHECDLFYLGTRGYLKTEEGLATINGYRYRKDKRMFRSALLYLAMDEASAKSFKDVFLTIYKITKKRNFSWNITRRVKRGLKDTSKPGAFTKDQYYGWAIDLAKKIKKDPTLINYLWNGKADIETLKKFSKPNKIDNKLDMKYINMFLNSNEL
jgi:hypothetical protein